MLVRTNSDLFSWGNFDRLFDDFVSPSTRQVQRTYSPAYDLEETDSYYLLSLDVPGVPREDIHIDLTGNTLTVSGERKFEHEESKTNLRYFERTHGKFSRAFEVPQNVDREKLEAQHRNGVLQIVLPKAESAKPRSIEVKAEPKGFFEKLIRKDKETV